MGSMFSGKPSTPKVPDYEEERKKEEAKAADKKKSLLNKGRSGTMLGGSTGDDANIKKAKLGA
ncbi:hypothetical protein [Halodesulfovibrio sp. MK-HDV]|uniref:hypothetical protein n=1 Tax=Halodesulfovibrio sp. MK-HDV TaxID=2599925 RepID=UPI00136E546F|nr:hypothetical protein [Halodesulfovibrio sp. MK-HDV]KAF1077656.1 hypothetical protein MKHDV_00112 [Halodesulfovibrio sp. MK-HDV]